MLNWDRNRLELGQVALPLVFCTVGVLELLAVVLGLVSTPTPSALAAAAGPGSFVGVTVAVVFATLLPATARGRFVKGVTAAAAAGFALVRLVLLIWLFAFGGAARLLELPLGLGAIVGVVIGIVLSGWAAIDVLTHQTAVTSAELPEPASPVMASLGPVSPVQALPAPVSPRVPQLPAGAPSPQGAPGPSQQQWHRGTTPWPRAVEEDPEGTLIRPPRRG